MIMKNYFVILKIYLTFICPSFSYMPYNIWYMHIVFENKTPDTHSAEREKIDSKGKT